MASKPARSFRDCKTTGPHRLPAQPAAIISTSAIHHLEPHEKRQVYQQCYDALEPLGILANGDEIRDEDDAKYRAAVEQWAAHMRQVMAAGRVNEVFAAMCDKWIDRNVGHFGEPRSQWRRLPRNHPHPVGLPGRLWVSQRQLALAASDVGRAAGDQIMRRNFGLRIAIVGVFPWLAMSLAIVASVDPAQAAEVRLSPTSVVKFADAREGAAALARRDDYIQQLSPFDLQVRTKTAQPVSTEQFLQFVASHARDWTPDEIARITPLLEALARKLAPWKLQFPAEILLVKTSGQEEGGAAYCRGAAIVLPQNMIDNRRDNLAKVLPHEIFHVLSSHNPELRQRLYATIGFAPCGEIALPDALARRKITNPDAPLNNYFIKCMWQGRDAEWLPVLISKSDYDPAAGGTLFSYLDFKLLLLENQNGVRRAALVEGNPVLVEPAELPDFARQIGDNTKYIIHPEEVLADNFVFLLDGRIDVPTPASSRPWAKCCSRWRSSSDVSYSAGCSWMENSTVTLPASSAGWSSFTSKRTPYGNAWPTLTCAGNPSAGSP